MSEAAIVHGVGLVLGEAGVLIRGPAGAGKTSLALELIDQATAMRRFARLVADDRVLLRERYGRVLMRPHPVIAGRVEIRGVGVVEAPHLPEAALRLVVDLDPDAARMPERENRATIAGVALPALVVQRKIAFHAIAHFSGAFFSTSRLE